MASRRAVSLARRGATCIASSSRRAASKPLTSADPLVESGSVNGDVSGARRFGTQSRMRLSAYLADLPIRYIKG